MFSVLAFCSNDPSLNPTESYNFNVTFVFEKNENKQKEAGLAQFKKSEVLPADSRIQTGDL